MNDLTQISRQIIEHKALDINDQVIVQEDIDLLKNIFLEDVLTLTSCQQISSSSQHLHFMGVASRIMGVNNPLPIINIATEVIIFDIIDSVNPAEFQRFVIIKLELTNINLSSFFASYNSAQPDAIVAMFSGAADDLLINTIELEHPHFTFSTVDLFAHNQAITYPDSFNNLIPKNEIHRGLNFKTNLELNADTLPLEHFPIPTTYHFIARIQPTETGYHLNLGLDLSTKFELSIFSFEIKDILLAFPLNSLGSYTPDLVMEGIVGVGGVFINVSLLFEIYAKALTVNFSGPTTPIQSISAFTDPVGVNKIGDYLPGAPREALGGFFLEKLQFKISFSPFFIQNFTLSITTERAISFIENVIEFTPYLTLDIQNPLQRETRKIQALIAGNWTIAQANFSVYLTYPDFYLQAEMLPGHILNTKDLLAKVMPDVENFPSILLQDMELSADFLNKSYEAAIDIATDWEIHLAGKAFAVRELDLVMEYAEKKVTTCEISGRLTLFSLDFDVHVAYDFSGGWLLSAGTSSGSVISLTSLVNSMIAEFSPASHDKEAIPTSFLDISIKDIFLEYKISASEFTFYVSLGHQIQISPAFIIDSIFAQIKVNNGNQEGKCIIQLIIAGVGIFLESEKLPQDKGWRFSGQSELGKDLPIGELITELAHKFNVDQNVPASIAGMTVKSIHIAFYTPDHNFSFGCEGEIPIGDKGKKVSGKLNIDLTKQDNVYKKDFGGQISVGPFDTLGILQFDLHFIQDKDSTLFAATYTHKRGAANISLKALLAHFSDDISDIPIDLIVDLKDIILVFDKKPNQPTKFLFALDISASLNLSKLPLVGKEFSADKSVGFDDLQFILTNAPIPQTEVQAWASHNLLPTGLTPLPVRDLNEGLSIDGKLNLGGFEKPIALPISGSNTPPVGALPATNQVTTPPTSPDKAKWFTLQKQIGPVYFERIGVQYEKGELWFLLDASLTAAGLTIALQGLSVGSSLKKFDPVFRLNGLGIDFKRGPLEIGGAFLHFGDFEYAGTAIIKTKALTLAAIGSYAELADGHKSLFIYAVLDYPLGGPAFFFVTGLAAGFGYNRRLRIPGIYQVANFPLVSEAVNGVSPIPAGAGQRDKLLGELTKIQTYIPPETGQYFLAVGIKFNSFKLIDSFALLTIAFGNHFEMDLLGLSTLVVPTPEAGQTIDPLAMVQMAIKVSFMPDEGFLGVEAQLTAASFLMSRKCHLTGGFAFYSWFEGTHKGDFVISVGGYHPNYQVPAHYPKVPRLGFNWQVTNQLSLKGEAYFALTASALMAGGRLEALWLDDNLKAWFIIGADFIIAWKPYYYDARMYVDMGVSYTFSFFGTHTISVDVGADLHIWGPDFSGTAHVKLWIITFDVTFGAGAAQTPKPIDWTTFRTSFLPASDQDIASISLVNGVKMPPAAGSGVDWIIDVKNFEFETNSLIPIKRGIGSEGNKTFGIAPMDLKSDQVDSSLQIQIKKKSNNPNIPDTDVRSAFKLEPILKNMPMGMWGTSVSPNLNGQKFVEAALTGYRIKLEKQEKEPNDKPDPIEAQKFQFTPMPLNNYIQLKDLPRFHPQNFTDWKGQLKKGLLINNQRNTLLNALGFSTATDVQLTDTLIDELTLAPQFSS